MNAHNRLAAVLEAIACSPCCSGYPALDFALEDWRDEFPAAPGQEQNGFTLIELMIAVAVMALVLTLGVPNFRATILDNRQVSDLNVLVAELNLARSEAVARNTWVTVKPLSGSGWQEGWRSFVDANSNGSFDTGEVELRTHDKLTSNLMVGYSGAGVTYSPMGSLMVYTSSPASGPGTFTFCDVRGWQKARGIILSANGRLRVARDVNGDKYPEDDAGNHLACP